MFSDELAAVCLALLPCSSLPLISLQSGILAWREGIRWRRAGRGLAQKLLDASVLGPLVIAAVAIISRLDERPAPSITYSRASSLWLYRLLFSSFPLCRLLVSYVLFSFLFSSLLSSFLFLSPLFCSPLSFSLLFSCHLLFFSPLSSSLLLSPLLFSSLLSSFLYSLFFSFTHVFCCLMSSHFFLSCFVSF